MLPTGISGEIDVFYSQNSTRMNSFFSIAPLKFPLVSTSTPSSKYNGMVENPSELSKNSLFFLTFFDFFGVNEAHEEQ
jgi:hypothetical protein